MKRLFAAICALVLCALPASSQFIADAKISVISTQVANNTTAVVLSSRPAVVYQVDAYNNSTTLAYIKLYAAATATCGTGTPLARYMIPFGTSSSGGGFVTPNINGDFFANGVTMCVTAGFADNDTSAPAASTYIVNVHLKQTVGP